MSVARQDVQDLIHGSSWPMDIQTLHALRLGLCVKVARGDITIQEATDIFENAREKVINRKKIEGLQEEKGI